MDNHHAEGDHNRVAMEAKDGGGMFDFVKQKDEKDDGKNEEKPSLTEKVLHRSNSNSSSSSDEEEIGEDGVKRKKKKGLKGKIKEKIDGHKEATENKDEPENPEEKKGFLEKIKEKLPGQHKDGAGHDGHPAEGEPKEKGILEKIKEKIPGCHGDKTAEDHKANKN